MLSSTVQLYKNAYKGLSLKTWYLSLVMFINRSGTMVIPFMSMYCTVKLGFSISQAGNIMALFGIGAIVGALIGGKITDTIGFYPLQIAALISGGIMFIVLGYMETYSGLCIGTFILSVCNESFRPANSTAIAFYSLPENRTRSYALNRLAINAGWAFGGALGGFIASRNYQLLFWTDGITNIAAAVLLMILLPYVKSGSRHSEKKQAPPLRSPYKDTPYILFLILTIIFAACFFMQFTMQSLFYKKEWHYSEQFVGFILAMNGIIITLVEMALVYKLDGRFRHTGLIASGILLVGIGFIIVNIFPEAKWVALSSITIITFGEILAMPFMNSYWIGRSGENNRGSYAALYTIAWSTAQVLGPVFGSRIVEHYGFSILWNIVFVICIFTSMAFFFLFKKER